MKKLGKRSQQLLDTLAFMSASSGGIVATLPKSAALRDLIVRELIATRPAILLRGNTLVGGAQILTITEAGTSAAKPPF